MPAAISRSRSGSRTPKAPLRHTHLYLQLHSHLHSHSHLLLNPLTLTHFARLYLWHTFAGSNCECSAAEDEGKLSTLRRQSRKVTFFPLFSATSTKIVSNSNSSMSGLSPRQYYICWPQRVLLKWVALGGSWMLDAGEGQLCWLLELQ